MSVPAIIRETEGLLTLGPRTYSHPETSKQLIVREYLPALGPRAYTNPDEFRYENYTDDEWNTTVDRVCKTAPDMVRNKINVSSPRQPTSYYDFRSLYHDGNIDPIPTPAYQEDTPTLDTRLFRFSIWQDLKPTNTVVRNSLPTLEGWYIYIYQKCYWGSATTITIKDS